MKTIVIGNTYIFRMRKPKKVPRDHPTYGYDGACVTVKEYKHLWSYTVVTDDGVELIIPSWELHEEKA